MGVLCGLLGLYAQASQATSEDAVPMSRPSNGVGPGGGLSPHFIADAASKAAPAVVNITVHQDGAELPDWFGGRFQDR